MVVYGIAWYLMVLDGIAWYCLVFDDITLYLMVSYGIQWYSMVLEVIACFVLYCLSWSVSVSIRQYQSVPASPGQLLRHVQPGGDQLVPACRDLNFAACRGKVRGEDCADDGLPARLDVRPVDPGEEVVVADSNNVRQP